MAQRQGSPGRQSRADRGPIPRGIEVLVKKASVDPDFRDLLLNRRAEAAGEIGLDLDPAEVMMLTAVPAVQLEAIIAQTDVPQEHRRAFLGKAAAAMLAAVGLSGSGCSQPDPWERCQGTRPQGRPVKDPPAKQTSTPDSAARPGRIEPSQGVRPPEE